DGDGLKDLITGKRFWAHGPQGDVEPNAPAVLYWFKLTRGPNGAEFVPHLIDNDSGVGTQVVATDSDGDKRPDIVVGNKKGLNVFLQRR
ncbi:MAG: VCBS repeat-containing protein, partial [Verrucomicrobiae bacterium]|nr:VCBS repeat-containing protein [Verrucomicrobiae bacterium]